MNTWHDDRNASWITDDAFESIAFSVLRLRRQWRGSSTRTTESRFHQRHPKRPWRNPPLPWQRLRCPWLQPHELWHQGCSVPLLCRTQLKSARLQVTSVKPTFQRIVSDDVSRLFANKNQRVNRMLLCIRCDAQCPEWLGCQQWLGGYGRVGRGFYQKTQLRSR